jgi:hypothetical protein
VISVVISFFLGIFIRQLHIGERTEKGYERIKEKIENLWYNQRGAVGEGQNMAQNPILAHNSSTFNS